MAEFIVVGVLTLIAAELNISVSQTGQLVTAYAFGISIGGPFLAAVPARVPRRRLLIVTMGVFVGANLVAGTSSPWPQLLAARFAIPMRRTPGRTTASILPAARPRGLDRPWYGVERHLGRLETVTDKEIRSSSRRSWCAMRTRPSAYRSTPCRTIWGMGIFSGTAISLSTVLLETLWRRSSMANP